MEQRVVFLDRQAIRVPLRPPTFPHDWAEYPHTPPESIVERLRGATIAITNRVPLAGATLDATPTLRLIAVSATGYEHVDVGACQARGIAVCNVRDWSIRSRSTSSRRCWRCADNCPPMLRRSRRDAGRRRPPMASCWSRCRIPCAAAHSA